MPDYNSGDYVYFNNITDKTKSRVGFILNQRHDMYITSPLKIMEENLYHFQNYLLKQILNHWVMTISKLLLSYQKSMYGTNIVNKWIKFILEERMRKIFWVMLIFQDFAMPWRNFLDWITTFLNKVLVFLYR